VDQSLRTNRETIYKSLWKKLEKLSKWPLNKDLAYQDLDTLLIEMKNWYFEEGGIYLSKKARGANGIVQKAIVEAFSGTPYRTYGWLIFPLRGVPSPGAWSVKTGSHEQ